MREWAELRGAVDDRKQRLDDSEVVQQYLFDAAEAEAWMGEQELLMMSDERAKVRISLLLGYIWHKACVSKQCYHIALPSHFEIYSLCANSD